MRHVRRAATRDVVLGVIAVLVIGLAIYFFVRGKSDVPAGAGDIGLYCANCKEHVSVSASAMADMIDKKDFRVVGGQGTLFKCPKCGQFMASRQDQAGQAQTGQPTVMTRMPPQPAEPEPNAGK